MPVSAVKMCPRLLSSGNRHHLAEEDHWIIQCTGLSEIMWEDIQIYKGLVGYLATDIDEYGSLHLFNWKTSQPLFVSRACFSLREI
jgi:hypothetical protein